MVKNMEKGTICSACKDSISNQEDFLLCTLECCKKYYHLFCGGGQALSKEGRVAWICPECCCASKKGGDNSSTPVGAKKVRDPNVTYRKKVTQSRSVDEAITPIKSPPLRTTLDLPRPTPQEGSSTLDLTMEIRGLRHEIATLKRYLDGAVAAISRYDARLGHYDAKLKCYENKQVEHETLSASFASQVESLHAKLRVYETNNASKMLAATQLYPLPAPNLVVTPEPASVSTQLLKPRPKSPKPQAQQAPTPLTTLCKSVSRDVNDDASQTVLSEKNTQRRDLQQWTEVRRKNRRNASKCGTANPSLTKLKAVEVKKYIHLWNMESGASEVSEYLRQLCTVGTCTVEELNPKGNYKSFKIGVPDAYFEMCMSTDIWPINARIKSWFHLKKPRRASSDYNNGRSPAKERVSNVSPSTSQSFCGPSTSHVSDETAFQPFRGDTKTK